MKIDKFAQLQDIDKIDVIYNNQLVGVLAKQKNGVCVFEYDNDWLENGFSLNPLELPLEKKLFVAKLHPFDGMFGVFIDSLPDGWGQLLTDRKLQSMHINPEQVSNLARLTLIGDNAKGALEYRPSANTATSQKIDNYDKAASACLKIFNSFDLGKLRKNISADIDEYFSAAGSSGGARPKINALIDGEEWIVKFASSLDPKNISEIEYKYMKCAQKCGIEVPEFMLIPSKKCKGYFAVKRFDRIKMSSCTKKIHTCTASGLLGVSHRIPSLDYLQLMQLTWALTHNNMEMNKMFKLMCFNVFAHNRDDHSNNFSFQYTEHEGGHWKLSPAYDLTYSSSLNGEHATTVYGNGANPGMDEILSVSNEAGLKMADAKNIAQTIEKIVNKDLGDLL